MLRNKTINHNKVLTENYWSFLSNQPSCKAWQNIVLLPSFVGLTSLVLLASGCVQKSPASSQTPPASSSPNAPNFTQAQYTAVLTFDYAGENGVSAGNPSGPSIGYPCGVPKSYAWKYGTGGAKELASAIKNRGKQLAGAAYNQIYNVCSGNKSRKSVPNARIEFTNINVDYFSISKKRWINVVRNQKTTGAAYAEDFVNDQSTGADYISKPDGSGYGSVRSGIGNATGDAGAATGRVVEDGPVGYNFHGFASRFNIDWADAQAVVVAQAMRCVPNSGTDLGDCQKMGYIANVGLDSWATTDSKFDGFKTHGGVGAGRFKPVTTSWQIFTNYNGPVSLLRQSPPPVPKF